MIGMLPHIFRGASSSRRMGWLMKISRAFVQRNRISYSASWTCLPGRLPRTGVSCLGVEGVPSSNRSITESRSGSVCSAI
jgi:hypothetical protein